jgi:DNA-binding NtrC family response regulator
MSGKPMDRGRVLVVDDSADTLEMIRRNLVSKGYETFTARGVPEALEFLKGASVDLVITDLKMPKVSGLDLVRHVHENLEGTEVMMITGYPSIEGAVDAIKGGAEAYLAKPFTDEELFAAVAKAFHKLRARRTAEGEAGESETAPAGILGSSRPMRRIYESIRKAARTNATVLITGESGTGKELVARAIHYGGPRASAAFVPINCGGIPEGLLESELFGHVKGSFTGAVTTRAGFFQTADGGSLFLDEIGEISPAMQVKLLRALQDKMILMVGSTRPAAVDVRILAATNKDLFAMVRKGLFREDLYFRINVITIEMPPLRERGDDILLLAQHFAEKHAREHDRPVPRFTDAAIRAFMGYPWPGNVREMENLTQRLVVMNDSDTIDVRDLPSPMRFSIGPGAGGHRTLAEVEAEHIRSVLASVGGNKTQAAAILGIDRKTLREKLRAAGDPGFDSPSSGEDLPAGEDLPTE